MNFKTFDFYPGIAKAVHDCGYTTPTNIQKQAMPHLLKGSDLLGLAQTGTGKTAAFVLPTLQKLHQRKTKNIRALVLTPTRELAEQVHENIQQLAKFSHLKSLTIYGGVSKSSQIKKIKRGADIAVACPGRLLDHINGKSIDLSDIEVLILDEADMMCDQGFLPDVRRILKHVPEQRQSMVFSATMPGEVRHFVEEILTDPVAVQIDHEKPAETISHALFQVPQNRKTVLLKTILQREDMSTTVVFTRTKHKAKNLARQLSKGGFKATSLQGNLSQNQRKRAMDGFRTGKFNILVATDIAARGIDVSGISHVVNYDVPDTVEAYTHRTGRTGRAENNGTAFTFATTNDGKIIRMIERRLGKNIQREEVADFNDNSSSFKPSNASNRNNTTKKRKSSAPPRRQRKNRSKRRSDSFDFGLPRR